MSAIYVKLLMAGLRSWIALLRHRSSSRLSRLAHLHAAMIQSEHDPCIVGSVQCKSHRKHNLDSFLPAEDEKLQSMNHLNNCPLPCPSDSWPWDTNQCCYPAGTRFYTSACCLDPVETLARGFSGDGFL